MATESNRPLTDEEKRKPLPGETSPENAAAKAREFSAREKGKLQKR